MSRQGTTAAVTRPKSKQLDIERTCEQLTAASLGFNAEALEHALTEAIREGTTA